MNQRWRCQSGFDSRAGNQQQPASWPTVTEVTCFYLGGCEEELGKMRDDGKGFGH